jgi:hypothetical protein
LRLCLGMLQTIPLFGRQTLKSIQLSAIRLHRAVREASKTYQGSYQVLDSESHAGGLLADILPGPVTWYGMTYSCGPSDGRLPSFAFKGQHDLPGFFGPRLA